MISQNNEAFIIAEVGQNHNGNLDSAMQYIRVFATAGADAVKFQTRNNKFLFSEGAYNKKYESENSFADTYGKHREILELKPEWIPLLQEECTKVGVKFMSTPFDEPSLDLLHSLNVDIIKIASFDLGNLPFIHRISKINKPVVMSVGGGKIDHIKDSVKILTDNGIDLTILHCVSEYPCDYNRLGLNNIELLAKTFPDCKIGLSDHFNGTLSGPIGYLKGARVFEKHVTLNRASKGTDHSFALEPEGFRKFVRDINRVRHMLEPKSVLDLGKEQVFAKLGKSIVSYVNIKKGELLSLDNLSGKIFEKTYIPVRESNKIIGHIATKDITEGQPILYSDFEIK